MARAILFYVAFAAVLCVGLTAGGASAAAVSAENDAAASASQASAVLAAAAGPGAVRVLEAGTRGANGWYNATPAALVTDADAQRFSCTRTHPQCVPRCQRMCMRSSPLVPAAYLLTTSRLRGCPKVHSLARW